MKVLKTEGTAFTNEPWVCKDPAEPGFSEPCSAGSPQMCGTFAQRSRGRDWGITEISSFRRLLFFPPRPATALHVELPHRRAGDAPGLWEAGCGSFPPREAALLTQLKRVVIETGERFTGDLVLNIDGRSEEVTLFLEPILSEQRSASGVASVLAMHAERSSGDITGRTFDLSCDPICFSRFPLGADSGKPL